ncbi:MAG: LysE family transporter [Pseudomonadota bacterium]
MIELLITAFIAGMLYVLVPGPATLAALSLSSTQGRASCARFLGCHLVGDLFWAVAAILAVIGLSKAGSVFFDLLGMVCGLYLIYLGIKALRAKGHGATAVVSDPARAGLIFGFTNPKAYPFSLALFTTVVARVEGDITFAVAFPLMAVVFFGFVTATLLVVFWTGLPAIRRMFVRYGVWITKAIGALFVALGAKSLTDASAGVLSEFRGLTSKTANQATV